MRTQIRKMVVGVATVDELDPILPTAVRLAESVGASLRVVHVLPLPEFALVSGYATAQAGYLEERSRSVEASLRTQCASFGSAPERISFHVLAGSPHRELTRFAAKVSADMLVIAATGHGKLWRSLLGTTAERVLRGTSIPVLVVHEPFYRPVKRILLTTDLTTLSAGVHERSLDVVEALFGDRDLICRSVFALGYTSPSLSLDLLTGAEPELDQFLCERRGRRYPIGGIVKLGEPATEVNVEADSWRADLIVVGTHGRTGFKRYVLGSVAGSILRDASRNVLVIPAAHRHGHGGRRARERDHALSAGRRAPGVGWR